MRGRFVVPQWCMGCASLSTSQLVDATQVLSLYGSAHSDECAQIIPPQAADSCRGDFLWNISVLDQASELDLGNAALPTPSMYLALGADVLTGGDSYRIELRVHPADSGGTGGFARVIVSVAQPPRGGSLLITPLQGKFGEDFLMRAAHFTDQNAHLPLTYRFGSEAMWFCDFQRSGLLSLDDVPQGVSQSIIVTAQNNVGAQTSASSVMWVEAPLLEDDTTLTDSYGTGE